jgi:hypothetical protein
MNIAPEVKAAYAYHEAGHAVAAVIAWSQVCTPINPPPLPVKFVEIPINADGKITGLTYGPSVYTPTYAARLGFLNKERFRDAMQWQITIDMAGGIAEAIHRGERNRRNMMWFALFNCGTEGDFVNAEAILAELCRLPPYRRHGLRRYAERACDLLRANWGAVETIAAALIEHDRIEGDRVSAMEHRSFARRVLPACYG